MSYIRCWTCNGNGIENHPPRWEAVRCTSCGGTGADRAKTEKYLSRSERSYPAPLPLLASERVTVEKDNWDK